MNCPCHAILLVSGMMSVARFRCKYTTAPTGHSGSFLSSFLLYREDVVVNRGRSIKLVDISLQRNCVERSIFACTYLASGLGYLTLEPSTLLVYPYRVCAQRVFLPTACQPHEIVRRSMAQSAAGHKVVVGMSRYVFSLGPKHFWRQSRSESMGPGPRTHSISNSHSEVCSSFPEGWYSK